MSKYHNNCTVCGRCIDFAFSQCDGCWRWYENFMSRMEAKYGRKLRRF